MGRDLVKPMEYNIVIVPHIPGIRTEPNEDNAVYSGQIRVGTPGELLVPLTVRTKGWVHSLRD
jgi:hypothetical protein